MILLVFAAYEVVALLAARKAYAAVRASNMAPEDNIEARLVGALMMFAGQFWPLALPIAAVLWRPRKTPDEVMEENQQMRDRIAALERELGIGGTR